MPHLHLALLLCGLAWTSAAQLPKGLKQCKQDEKLNDCVLEVSKVAIPTLVKGNKKARIPVLDPLKIERIEIQEGNDKSNFIDVTFTKMEVIGLKDTQMINSEMDVEAKTVKWTFFMKSLKLVADYDMKGKFLLVPITGKGKSTISIEGGTFQYYYDYTIKEKDGEEYIVVEKPNLTYDLARVIFNFENLFNGNKELGDTVNQMLNDNWRDIDKKLGPALSEAILLVLNEILFSITSNVPYKELFA